MDTDHTAPVLQAQPDMGLHCLTKRFLKTYQQAIKADLLWLALWGLKPLSCNVLQLKSVCHIFDSLNTFWVPTSESFYFHAPNYFCMLGNFPFFCRLQIFFKIIFSKYSFRNKIRVSSNLDPDSGQMFCHVWSGSKLTALVKSASWKNNFLISQPK